VVLKELNTFPGLVFRPPMGGIRRAVIERIPGLGDSICLNPCLVYEAGRTFMAVRVESRRSYWRDKETWDPEIRFFERVGKSTWRPCQLPKFERAEDPFATWMNDSTGRRLLIFGIVSLDFDSEVPTVVTKLFVAPTIAQLDPGNPILEFHGMKDIRLLQRSSGVVVCGRPRGGPARRGRISFAILDNLESLSPGIIQNAHLFEEQVLSDDLYLGANELYDLGDHIGVLGHVAIGDESVEQHYAAAWWTIDPSSRTVSPPYLFAVRSDFPPGPEKRATAADVVFPGSLEALGDGWVRLYCGLSDASVGSAVMRWPFSGTLHNP
jgi:Protein of unknown function (DUF1861)